MYTPITITEPRPKDCNPLYLCNRTRYPTVTDVKFLNATHLLVAHRYAGKLYLVEMTGAQHTVISSIQITRNGIAQQNEAFTVIGNTVYLIDFAEYLYIIKIENDTLVQQETIKLNETSAPYHHIVPHGEHLYFTPSTQTEKKNEPFLIYNPTTRKKQKIESVSPKYRYKSIGFLPNDNIILLINHKSQTTLTNRAHISHGAIKLYSPDWQELHSVEFNKIHFDHMIVKNHYFYVTTADSVGGYIYWGYVTDNKISNVYKFPTADFPHGIDIYDNTLAYTSYSSSAVYFIPLSQIHNASQTAQ